MKNILALLGLALLCPGFALAQTGIVEGVVLDPTGETVPAANVALVGTAIGTATGADGRFRFSAPAGDHTLIVTFVGYADYTAPITVSEGETLELSIQLEEGTIDLDEVVVTALGIEREERSLGYSFQEVDNEALERSNESNLVNALAGKVAGVQVTSSSGQPGKAARIVIRGNSSLTGNNQPLFVIDGVPISNAEDANPEASDPENPVFQGGAINRAVDIDPNVIEDITVLKGASAMALYGSRAANGAIIITTKGARGTDGARVTFSSTTRWDEAVVSGFQDRFTLGNQGCFRSGAPLEQGGVVDEACFVEQFGLTPEQAAQVSPQSSWNWGPSVDEVNANPELLEALGVEALPTYDPRRDFYRTGAVLENNLSISGGALGGNYFLSGTMLDQEGVVRGTKMDRYNLLAKFGANLTEQLDVETSVGYTRTQNNWVGEGNGTSSFLYGLNFAPINFDLSEIEYEDGTQRIFSGSFNNPFWLVENNGYTSDVDRFIGGIKVGYQLLPWLVVSERVGIDTYTDTRKGKVEVGSVSRPNGSLFDQTLNRREINSDLILTVDRRFDKIGVSGLIGNNINRQYFRYSLVNGTGLGVPGFFNIGNAATVTSDEYLAEQMIVGLYAQGTFDYDDWAYLTLTARNDWSSTLPEDNNSYFYPSVSVGLVFTEAARMFDRTPLSFGKLRASWARIGNDAPVYATSTTFVQSQPGDGQRGEINFPVYGGINAYQQTNILGNPDLKPELSSEYEIGLDLRFFGQRARLDAAYYNRSTTDQIFSVPVSAATGFVQRLLNAGEIRNSGYELFLGLTPIQTRDFAWDISANWSKNTTEVVELTEGVESIFLAGFTNPQIRIQEGEDGYGVIWGDQFARADRDLHADLFAEHPELEEGMLLIGEDGLPIIADELGAIGNVQPDWLANFRTSLTFKGLSASALLDVRRGGDVLNMDLFYTTFYGVAEQTEDRGTTFVYEGFNVANGGLNDVEVVRDQDYYQTFFSSFAENWVEDGSFIKLRELSLSYTIPQNWAQRARLQSASLTVTGRNLWIGTDFSYGDPEGSIVGSANGQGFYHMVTPSTKSYSLGLRLTI